MSGGSPIQNSDEPIKHQMTRVYFELKKSIPWQFV